jgi:acetyl-CoA carboxylase carboxyl transferase subunit alpha
MKKPSVILPFERPIYELEEKLNALEKKPTSAQIKESIRNMRVEITHMKKDVFSKLDPWEVVQVARHPDRPQLRDYIELVFDEFVELHGDKSFGDDRALMTGFARLGEHKVMLIGQHKGRNLQERNECYYGCAHPEGYKKALSKMQMAEKYGIPIVCLIDTPGAYPGVGAEERGQAYHIALNLREMSQLETPIVCTVIGEGGSGGALGIGIGNHVSVLEFAYYSVISPEGCAGILWKHVKHADRAARALKFTSQNLLKMGIVDEIVQEPLGAAHRNHRQMAAELRASLMDNLKNLKGFSKEELVNHRYEKFRNIGVFEDNFKEEESELSEITQDE